MIKDIALTLAVMVVVAVVLLGASSLVSRSPEPKADISLTTGSLLSVTTVITVCTICDAEMRCDCPEIKADATPTPAPVSRCGVIGCLVFHGYERGGYECWEPVPTSTPTPLPHVGVRIDVSDVIVPGYPGKTLYQPTTRKYPNVHIGGDLFVIGDLEVGGSIIVGGEITSGTRKVGGH